MFARALLVFLLIATVEVLHGIARVIFLAPRLGDFPARQFAVFTGSALILLAHGGLLPLGMVVLAFAPLVAARVRQLPAGRQ